MVSRICLLGNLQRATVALALLVPIPSTAGAQYGSGGTAATTTYPGGTAKHASHVGMKTSVSEPCIF